MSNDKSIFVISDLHMGDGSARDNFGYEDSAKPAELTKFLDYVQIEKGELIIVGDLFEFWQASLSKVIMKNISLLERFADMGATYVLGNHDVDLKDFIGKNMLIHPFFKNMREHFTRNIGDKKFKFMHGHEVDDFNKGDAPGWGRMLAIFAGIFEERNNSPMLPDGQSVEEELSKFGECVLDLWNWLVNKLKKSVSGGDSPRPKNELTPAQNKTRAEEMLKMYATDREAEGYDIAIVGHTHIPGRAESGWYFNTGSWATSGNNFVRIEPDGSVDVFNWESGKPVPNTEVLCD